MSKGQLGYEYVIIVGILVTFLVPFFYYFFDVLHHQLNTYYATAAVVTIAEATRTVTNLYSGSTVRVPVRVPGNVVGVTSSGGMVALQFSDGEAIGETIAGQAQVGPLTGTGPKTARVTNIVDGYLTISFGGPVIACLTLEGGRISRKTCESQLTTSFTMMPSDKMVVVGSDISSGTTIKIEKEEKGVWSEENPHDEAWLLDNFPEEATEAADGLDMQEPIFGKGNYRMTLVASGGQTSNTVYFIVGSGGGGGEAD